MIVDANELSDGSPLDADLCIVGAGAAGISMALQLVDAGLDVLVLESGGDAIEPDTQSLYEGEVADAAMHSPPDRYRQRRFGGSTSIWGGRCTPLDPIDFEARDWVPDSGWPIGAEDLAPWYPEANRLCEAGACAYTASTAFDRPLAPMIDGFAPQDFSTDTLERFSCPTDFARRYGHKLRAAPRLRVMLHANVTALHLDASRRRVASANVKTLAGKSFTARARRFVLATGGLEVVRLLLASRDQAPNGIGNDHDVVGRYYMCHLAGTIGNLRFHRPARVWHGYDVADDGTYCRRRIALSAAAQREHRLGNFIARVHHPRITDPSHRNGPLSLLNLLQALIPYEYGKRLHGDERQGWRRWSLHLRNVLTGPIETIGFAWHLLTRRMLAERKFPSIIVRARGGLYSIDFHAEQRPDRDSRVILGDTRDVLGMPRLKICWSYNAGDLDTAQRALALLARAFDESGTGRFEYDPATVEFEMTRYGAYGGHHIGTARMGRDPRTSVVDAHCAVHGVENLYIASAAVFPTSSQANPTLTIVALSLRLAARLRTLFEADRAPSRRAASSASAAEHHEMPRHLVMEKTR